MTFNGLKICLLVSGLAFGGLFGHDAYAFKNVDGIKCIADESKQNSFLGDIMTSGYGLRQNTGGGSVFHRGIDIRTNPAAGGNPNVNAYYGGVVTRKNDPGGYGDYITVTNGNFQVLYGHASQLAVQTGQTVTAGQFLGDWGGLTGRGNAPHLHLEYQVKGADGEWYRINPIIGQQMMEDGIDLTDPANAQEAIDRTATECDVDPNALQGGAGAGGYYNEINEMCDPNIKSQLVTLNKATVAFHQNAMQQIIVPPPAPSMVANTPCMSKELQRVSDKFASMPGQMMGGMTGGLGGGSDPISGIMNKFFESGIQSINKAAENIPGMLNFQQLASEQLGNLLGNLGLGDAFSSELCGMMVDMVVNFLECQFPIEMPQMPSLDLGFGSLNDLMPEGCAGNAMREGLYKAADSLPDLSQTFTAPRK